MKPGRYLRIQLYSAYKKKYKKHTFHKTVLIPNLGTFSTTFCFKMLTVTHSIKLLEPLKDERINKMWYRRTREYYSALKRNEILTLAMRMDLEDLMISKISKSQKK